MVLVFESAHRTLCDTGKHAHIVLPPSDFGSHGISDWLPLSPVTPRFIALFQPFIFTVVFPLRNCPFAPSYFRRTACLCPLSLFWQPDLFVRLHMPPLPRWFPTVRMSAQLWLSRAAVCFRIFSWHNDSLLPQFPRCGRRPFLLSPFFRGTIWQTALFHCPLGRMCWNRAFAGPS